MSEAATAAIEQDWDVLCALCRLQERLGPSILGPATSVISSIDSARQSNPPPSDIDVERLLSFLNRYPEAWQAIWQVLGHAEAVRLAQLPRNEAMTTLRVEHRWSLQAIGDLFDLSRERVRQLTPSIDGNGSTPDLEDGASRDPAAIRNQWVSTFRRAVRTPEAWDGRGQVSKSWVIEQLGYEPDLPEVDFRSLTSSKAAFILEYGLGLQSKQSMRAWVEEMYFRNELTYAEIAHWLSARFVPIAPMTIHRFATEMLDIDGYGRGERRER